MDYKKYYHLEEYLFDEVGKRFIASGEISPEDFFCIISWKANRAKTKTKKRLAALAGGSYGRAVELIASGLKSAQQSKDRMKLLMKIWGFQLPMASAILTVLYPTEFTVYDVRICEMLGRFHDLAARGFTDNLWESYLEFKMAVEDAAPDHLALRDKDRYLWGKSFYEQVKRDVL
jgi:hypothetical protein